MNANRWTKKNRYGIPSSLLMAGIGILGITTMTGWLGAPTSYAQTQTPTNQGQTGTTDAQPPQNGAGCGPGSAFGAPPTPPGPPDLVQALGLTDDQAKQLKSIEDDFRAQLKALRDARKQKTIAILTPDQVTKFNALPAPLPAPDVPGAPGRRGMAPPTADRVIAQLKEKITLAADQETQIRAILATAKTQEDQLRKSLGSSKADSKSIHDQIRKLHDDAFAKVQVVLTDAQKAELPSPPPPPPGPPAPQGSDTNSG